MANSGVSMGVNDSRSLAPLISIFHCPVEEETDPTAQWPDMRIWKMDLRGAYTLLSYSPNDTPLFAMELSDDLITVEVEHRVQASSPLPLLSSLRAVLLSRFPQHRSRPLLHLTYIVISMIMRHSPHTRLELKLKL
jgi:hypothetical protein